MNCSFQGESLLDQTNAEQLSEELGFVLWYSSVLADALDKRLENIATDHVDRMQAILKDKAKV